MPKANRGPHLVDRRQDKGAWYIRWYAEGKAKYRSTGTEDVEAAAGVLADFIRGKSEERELAQRPNGPCHPNQRLIAAALLAYDESRSDPHKGAVSIKSLRSNMVPLLEFWGNVSIADITEETCDAYCRHRASLGRKPGTYRKELGTLRSAIRLDHKKGNVTSVPFVWLPPPPAAKTLWLERQDFTKLVRAARQSKHTRRYLSLFCLIAIYTAARKEAILSLRWSQVDLERRLINFNPPGREQTNKGRPIVPIHPRLLTVLRAYYKRGADLGHVLTNEAGERIRDFRVSFMAACVRAGFGEWGKKDATSPSADGKRVYRYKKRFPITAITPHTLRHTAASWMVQAGVSFDKVASYLGHVDDRMVRKVYGHLSPEYHLDAMEALGGRRRKVTLPVTLTDALPRGK